MPAPSASQTVGVLVGAAALAVTSPVALVASAWVGGGAIAVGLRDAAWTYAVAGVLIVTAACLVVAVWATVPGIVRGRRRPMAIALIVIIVLIGLAASRAWPVVVASWMPRALAITLLVIAGVALIANLILRRAPRDPIVGVAPAVAGLVGAYVLVAAVVALPGQGIPQFPRPLWLSSIQSGPGEMSPMPGSRAPQNPSLAPGEGSTIHNDSWMTDAYSTARLPDPANASVLSFFAGGDCASLLWNDRREIVAVCVSPTDVRGYILDPRTLVPRVERRISQRPLAVDALTNFSGGGYAVLDAQQRLVTPLPGGVIARFDGRDLTLIDEFDVRDQLLPDEGITSVIPDWSGLLWFVGREGSIGLLDPTTGTANAILSGQGGDPVDIENSFAVTEQGAYVVTGEELMLVEALDGAPVITWRAAYDRGSRLKPGQTSRASGTTPTVFGDAGRYVAITDNADPRMHVVVYDVSGSVPRQVCAVPVFDHGMSATENSLIALGDSLYVESNYGYSVTAVAGGHTTVPGLARIDVTDAGCAIAWETSDVTIPSLVSKGLIADGALLTYTKEFSPLGTDAWWFTAVDAKSGDVIWRRLAGVGPLLNNHYAAGYVGSDGSVYIGTISGVVALVSAS
ncbi:MAG: hypothetical protein RL347_1122 [Actinomycetota bacterium]|jgi:hypothetical protein